MTRAGPARVSRTARPRKARATLLAWAQDEKAIAERVRSRFAPLKIVLKTRDDPFHLREWITHHRAIVPDHALVIFDNGSRDPAATNLLAALPPDVVVCSYDGFHNRIHEPALFRPLYAALVDSCRFYAVLDTDERLYATDGTTAFADARVVDRVEAADPETLLPGLWLQARDGARTDFHVADGADRMTHGWLWGKPIVPSSLGVPNGFINHNTQLLADNDVASMAGGILVLHLAMLDARQRIRANLAKLLSKGYIASAAEWPRVLLDRARLAAADPHVKSYVTETLLLSRPGALAYRAPQRGEGGWGRIGEDGTLSFADGVTAETFRQAVLDPAGVLQSRGGGAR